MRIRGRRLPGHSGPGSFRTAGAADAGPRDGSGAGPSHEPLIEPGEETTMTERDDRGTSRRRLLRAGLALTLGAPLGNLGIAGAVLARGEDLDTPETFRPGEIVE